MNEILSLSEYQFSFGSWIRHHKLRTFISNLFEMVDSQLTNDEMDNIQYGLIGTNDEKEKWYSLTIKGKNDSIQLLLAFDYLDNDIILYKVSASKKFKEKITKLDNNTI